MRESTKAKTFSNSQKEGCEMKAEFLDVLSKLLIEPAYDLAEQPLLQAVF